jgi:uncharacterized surface protein with fasciclin (FAS1) repeats
LQFIAFDSYVGDPNKAFAAVPYVSEWSGTLDGPSTDYGLAIFHGQDPMSFIAASSFVEVAVDGKEGGLEMDSIGDRPDPSSDWWGEWVITNGTGDLEGLRGNGTFWGPGFPPPAGGTEECEDVEMGVIYYSVDDMYEVETAAPAEIPDVMAPVESAPVSGNTIVDVAVNDGRFDTLVSAITAAGLADALSGGEWTVFAPTDEAFAKLPAGTVESLLQDPKGALTDILLYHALVGEVNSDAAVALQGDITMANGQLAGLKLFGGDLYVNDDSKVITADIFTDNGVIHVVDTVILPPWPRTEE